MKFMITLTEYGEIVEVFEHPHKKGCPVSSLGMIEEFAAGDRGFLEKVLLNNDLSFTYYEGEYYFTAREGNELYDVADRVWHRLKPFLIGDRQNVPLHESAFRDQPHK